mmetsp:Transcript_34122/g.77857  ORF Transcript_34122/g.77857 Transcript_34122/m.77857 type:complete len:585 (+) Transcript_34122:77-1831(+)
MYVYRPQHTSGHAPGGSFSGGRSAYAGRQGAKKQRQAEPKRRKSKLQERRSRPLNGLCGPVWRKPALLPSGDLAQCLRQRNALEGAHEDPCIDLDDSSGRAGRVHARLCARLVERRTDELIQILERRHGNAWATYITTGGFHADEGMKRICEGFGLRPHIESQVLRDASKQAEAWQKQERGENLSERGLGATEVEPYVGADDAEDSDCWSIGSSSIASSVGAALSDIQRPLKTEETWMWWSEGEDELYGKGPLFPSLKAEGLSQSDSELSTALSSIDSLGEATGQDSRVTSSASSEALSGSPISSPEIAPSCPAQHSRIQDLCHGEEVQGDGLPDEHSCDEAVVEPPRRKPAPWRRRVLQALGLQPLCAEEGASADVPSTSSNKLVEAGQEKAAALQAQTMEGTVDDEEKLLAAELAAALQNAEEHARSSAKGTSSSSDGELDMAPKCRRTVTDPLHTRSKAQVRFATCSEVRFFLSSAEMQRRKSWAGEQLQHPETRPETVPEYQRELFTKDFDGPSGHKAKRSFPSERKDGIKAAEVETQPPESSDEGSDCEDDEEWEDHCDDIADLMSQQRHMLLWSQSWA